MDRVSMDELNDTLVEKGKFTSRLTLLWPWYVYFIEKKLRETERGRERRRAWQVIAGGNQGCVMKGGDLWHFNCARRVQQSNTQWPWGLSQTNYFSMLVLANKWTCAHWTHTYTFQSLIMRLRGAIGIRIGRKVYSTNQWYTFLWKRKEEN